MCQSEGGKETLIPRERILKLAVIFLAVSAFLALLLALPSNAQELPERPRPHVVRDKAWLALSAGAYTAAIFDMRQTMHEKQVRGSNFVEYNPLAKPLVNLPKPAYYAAGLGIVTGINQLAWQMRKSQHWYRHIWWMPQVASIAANTYGFARTKAMSSR